MKKRFLWILIFLGWAIAGNTEPPNPDSAVFFFDRMGVKRLPEGLRAEIDPAPSNIRISFTSELSEPAIVGLMLPYESQELGRVITIYAAYLGRQARLAMVRIPPGMESVVILEYQGEAAGPVVQIPSRPPDEPFDLQVLDETEQAAARNAILAWVDGETRRQVEKNLRRWDANASELDRDRELARVRGQLLNALGGMPERTELTPRMTGILERDGYLIEKWLLEFHPGPAVPFHLYLPEGLTRKAPAILLHAPGPDGKNDITVQNLCQNLVRQGSIALAFDALGQGERAGEATELPVVGNQCTLVGANLAGLATWDAIRLVDFLTGHPLIDATRIGTIGTRKGASSALLLAALDERIRVIAATGLSGSIFPQRMDDLWKMGVPSPEDFLSREIADGFCIGSRCRLIAPRPLLIQYDLPSADFYPFEEILSSAFTIGEDTLLLSGKSQGMDHANLIRWIVRWLNPETDSHPSTDFSDELLSVEESTCFPPEEKPSRFLPEIGIPVSSISRSMPSEISDATQAVAIRSELQELLGSSLGRIEVSEATAQMRTGVRTLDVSVGKTIFYREDDVPLPALIFVPTGIRPRNLPILYLGRGGKPRHPGDLDLIGDLLGEGFPVIAPDLRTQGETRLAKTGPVDLESVLAYTLFRQGNSLAAEQTRDLLAVITRVCESTETHRIGIYAEGDSAIPALFASALDERVRTVFLNGPLVTFRELLNGTRWNHGISIVHPGILSGVDLPDVAAAASTRLVMILNPVNRLGEAMDWRNARLEYSFASTLASFRGGVVRVSSHPPESIRKETLRWFVDSEARIR